MHLLFCCQMVTLLKNKQTEFERFKSEYVKNSIQMYFFSIMEGNGKVFVSRKQFSLFLLQVRQFMTGIRNYLVKHGEGELEDLIEHERSRLRQDEILNIDNIIERSLHICVLHPLKLHIYNLFVTEYTRLEPLVSHCNGRKSYNT